MDTVPTMPGISSSGNGKSKLFIKKKKTDDERSFPGCPVHEQGLSDLLHA
jgi:hypothetical protein